MKPELKSSPSGIPQAPFIEDVEQHLGGADADVTPTLQKFQETMQKYKIMEASTFQRSKSLQEKIPDIEKTLKMVEHLRDLKVSARYVAVQGGYTSMLITLTTTHLAAGSGPVPHDSLRASRHPLHPGHSTPTHPRQSLAGRERHAIVPAR